MLVTTGSPGARGAPISFHFSLPATSRSRTDSPLLEFFSCLTNEITVLIIAFRHPAATRTVRAYGQDRHPSSHCAPETKPAPAEKPRGNSSHNARFSASLAPPNPVRESLAQHQHSAEPSQESACFQHGAQPPHAAPGERSSTLSFLSSQRTNKQHSLHNAATLQAGPYAHPCTFCRSPLRQQLLAASAS